MAVGGWICLLAPLAGALLITLAGGRISRRTAGWISTLTTFVAFGGALTAFFATWSEDAADREHLSTAYTWLAAGDFEVGFQILVDPLSTVMMLVVSGVGGLIVWYSMGYMAGDDEERRYFAYMSLFVFSMLMLVEAGNFLLLLVGWGLVGLASYLLIGFWHKRPEAVAAAKKAFVMNACRGRDVRARRGPADLGDRDARVRRRLRAGRRPLLDDGEPRRAGPARRRGREVGADTAPHLAPGRHGGPDAGVRPDPRRDDGDRGRVPARPGAPRSSRPRPTSSTWRRSSGR